MLVTSLSPAEVFDADGDDVKGVGNGDCIREMAGQRCSERFVQIAHRDDHRQKAPLTARTRSVYDPMMPAGRVASPS